MSHYTTLETVFTEPEALMWALKEVGFSEVEFHSTPAALYGYLGDKRGEQANIIVRREFVGQASNDLGFLLTDEGTYQAIISDYDAKIFGPRWMRRLQVEYSRGCVYSFAQENGYTVNEERVTGKKEIRLTLSRFA